MMTLEQEQRLLQIVYDVRTYIVDGFLALHPMTTEFLQNYQRNEWERLIREMDSILSAHWNDIKK